MSVLYADAPSLYSSNTYRKNRFTGTEFILCKDNQWRSCEKQNITSFCKDVSSTYIRWDDDKMYNERTQERDLPYIAIVQIENTCELDFSAYLSFSVLDANGVVLETILPVHQTLKRNDTVQISIPLLDNDTYKHNPSKIRLDYVEGYPE